MRQDQRLRRHDGRTPHEIEGAVRHVDHDTQRIAAAHHIGAEISQAAVNRGFRLDVAEFVDAIVGQLQVSQLMQRKGFVGTLKSAFEKIRTFRRNDRARPGCLG